MMQPETDLWRWLYRRLQVPRLLACGQSSQMAPVKTELSVLFILIHQNGRKKLTFFCTAVLFLPLWWIKMNIYNNTKTIKSERKIEANNLTKLMKTCKFLPIQFMIYSGMNQIDIEQYVYRQHAQKFGKDRTCVSEDTDTQTDTQTYT